MNCNRRALRACGARRMEAWEQWLRAWPDFPALRDRYLSLCRRAGGESEALGAWGGLLAAEAAAAGLAMRASAPDAAGGGAKAALLSAPFWALNRLTGAAQWRQALAAAAQRLPPGGLLAFDLCPAPPPGAAAKADRIPRLAADGDAGDGRRRMIWETWRQIGPGRRAECRLGVEELLPDGTVAGKSYLDIGFRLVAAEEVEEFALQAGFSVEAAGGGEGAGRVWTLRREEGGT